MFQLTYRFLYLAFSIYTFWYTSSYALFEINQEKNKSGGIVIIIFTSSVILFTNFLIWQV